MVSQTRNVITIDGLAASGKSTLAKLLAQSLGFLHVNTGLLYRASAYLALKEGIPAPDSQGLVELLSRHSMSFEYSAQSGSRLLLDGEDCTDLLQTSEVASFTSKIAVIPELRDSLRIFQIEAFPGNSIVVEGRDTGTVIFPDADLKFFIEGDPLIRASRRAKDLKAELSETELEQLTLSVAQELKERDARDLQREYAPLKKASDAVVIDNSVGELGDTVREMVRRVRERLKS